VNAATIAKEGMNGHKEQCEDHELSNLYKVQRSKKIQIKNKVLVREWADPTTGRLYEPLLVLPRKRRHEIMKEMHELANHAGVARTLDMLVRRVWWPHMHQDVKQWVRSCDRCQRAKPDRSKKSPLQPIRPQHKWDMLALDIKVLHQDDLMYKYILVVADLYTKWVEAFPMRDKTAMSMVDLLEKEIFLRYGAPKQLLTDREKSLLGTEMKALLDRYGVKKVNTAAYHPQTNGVVERFNQTISQYLLKLTPQQQRQWHIHLPRLIHYYRCQKHPSTGVSPYFMIFGRDPMLPIDHKWMLNPNIRDTQTEDEIHEKTEENRTPYLTANGSPQKSERATLNISSKRSRALQKTTENRKKLQTRWRGPMRITKLISPLTVLDDIIIAIRSM